MSIQYGDGRKLFEQKKPVKKQEETVYIDTDKFAKMLGIKDAEIKLIAGVFHDCAMKQAKIVIAREVD